MSELPPEITAEEAKQRADDGALLLDVREADEWIAGHAPDAVHIALGDLQAEYTSLPKDRPIVAICRVGGRSQRATVALREIGYDVVNMTGGMRAWDAAGQPIVTDDGAAGQVI